MKKILAAILCVCMLISLLPFMAFADDVPGDPVVGAPLSGEGGQAQSPVGAGAAPAAEGESEGDPAPQAAAAVEGMETTADGDSIPTDWDGELTDDPKTITITEADPEEKSGNKIKVTNIHIYVDEEAPDWFEGTDIQEDSHAGL